MDLFVTRQRILQLGAGLFVIALSCLATGAAGEDEVGYTFAQQGSKHAAICVERARAAAQVPPFRLEG